MQVFWASAAAATGSGGGPGGFFGLGRIFGLPYGGVLLLGLAAVLALVLVALLRDRSPRTKKPPCAAKPPSGESTPPKGPHP